MGFSGFFGFSHTDVDSINGGNWQISEGWTETFAYGKWPYLQLGSRLMNDKPKRNIFKYSFSNITSVICIFVAVQIGNDKSILNYEMKEPYYAGPCGSDVQNPVVWLECEDENKKSTKTLSEIGFESKSPP